jgi:glycosyltransferase involved in cell wall biosynthesis
VIDAYAQLPEAVRRGHQLVISGHMLDHENASFLQIGEELGLGNSLVLAGFVDDEALTELYQAAELCLYPSLYEGFGLPILEAMRCSTPVVTSDCSSMKELVEIDEARFDPEDPAAMAKTIERLLTDQPLRDRMVEYGKTRSQEFTWKISAARTAEEYAALAGRGNGRGKARTTRLRQMAIVTPFPPDQSGIADYTRRVLDVLCDRHPLETHVVVNGDPLLYQGAATSSRVIAVSVSQFKWLAEHGYYDSIVYCMGNSPHHGYIYELMKEHPGTVWLHDIRLTDFYRWYFQEHLGRSIQSTPPELAPWARRYPSASGDLLLRDNVTQHVQGIYLAAEVASLAQRLIVGSQFSKELIEIEGGTPAPVVVVPHAALNANGSSGRQAWPSLASRYRLDPTGEPIISIGITWSTKCPEPLIAAFAQVVAENPQAILGFVGYCNEGYRRDLQKYADRLGVGERIFFTGHVEESELDDWLAACRCAVQLRFPTNGESSGAVMRCLAEGVPTIVSDHGPLRELPDDAVVKVPAPVEPSQLADAMRSVIGDQALRSRLHDGALRYSKEVSLQAIADRFWTEVVCAE